MVFASNIIIQKKTSILHSTPPCTAHCMGSPTLIDLVFASLTGYAASNLIKIRHLGPSIKPPIFRWPY